MYGRFKFIPLTIWILAEEVYYGCFLLQQDQFERILPTFIQVINLTEHEEFEYWAIMSAVFEGRQVDSITSNSSRYNWPTFESNSMEASINNKV